MYVYRRAVFANFVEFYTSLPRSLLALDIKVYAQAIAAVKALEHEKHMKKTSAEVKRGCGRQVTLDQS